MGQGGGGKNSEQGQEGTLKSTASVCASVKTVTASWESCACQSSCLLKASSSWAGQVWALDGLSFQPCSLGDRKVQRKMNFRSSGGDICGGLPSCHAP